ncbi:hypothetical protein PF002_g880 [Phytophthora fragariae]|uniref:Uncharacterized protein n=1 Tax=Phytophthora fragariae TaxID=53985 RepID=A0A6A4AK11_9STRA|nr:hypothetical protein PF002_g880 [Phytophthora fragariae]
MNSSSSAVVWRKERREYEDTIRNRANGETDDLVVSTKNTLDEGLLRQWCRLRWKLSIDGVTDATILAEVEKIISTVKNNSVPDIDQEMAENLRMDLDENDGRNQLCSKLIKSLEPKVLREEIDRTARFQTRKAKEDEVVLYDLILEKALDHEKDYQSQCRSKRDRDRGDRDRGGRDRETELLSLRVTSKRPTKKPRLSSEPSGGGSRVPAKSPAERPKVPPTPCPHWAQYGSSITSLSVTVLSSEAMHPRRRFRRATSLVPLSPRCARSFLRISAFSVSVALGHSDSQ